MSGPFSFHVPASHYRRRPRVSLGSHWQRKARAERFGRIVDAVILLTGFVTLGAFTLKVFALL